MHILITKDASTKIPREVASLQEARDVAASGFHVELLDEEGKTHPLPAEPTQDEPQAAVATTADPAPENVTEPEAANPSPAPAAKKTAAAKTTKKR